MCAHVVLDDAGNVWLGEGIGTRTIDKLRLILSSASEWKHEQESRSQTIEAAVVQRKIVPLVQIFGFSYAVEYLIHSMMRSVMVKIYPGNDCETLMTLPLAKDTTERYVGHC